MRKRRQLDPVSQAVKKHGFLTVQRALTCLASWSIFFAKTGEDGATIERYSEWWGQVERTSYRELAAWRKVTNDADLWVYVRQVVETYRAELVPENRQAVALGMVPMLPVV